MQDDERFKLNSYDGIPNRWGVQQNCIIKEDGQIETFVTLQPIELLERLHPCAAHCANKDINLCKLFVCIHEQSGKLIKNTSNIYNSQPMDIGKQCVANEFWDSCQTLMWVATSESGRVVQLAMRFMNSDQAVSSLHILFPVERVSH